MKITTVNVGQGHLTIVTHNDEAIVIDTRIPPNDESYDFVKKRLAETVSGKNVIGLMLTGFDADHTDVRGALSANVAETAIPSEFTEQGEW